MDVTAVLLVGGMGTRLRSVVPSTPKPLAEVGGDPFLKHLIRQLKEQGITRIVMCTGYLGNQIERVFGDGSSFGVTIGYSQEATPMGTGGAIKLAAPHLCEAPEFLVMNGDSFLDVDFGEMFRFHRERGGLASMAVLPTGNASRFGTVQVDIEDRVTGFAEKTGLESPGTINGGAYIFNQGMLDFIPDGTVSLEKDVFPQVLQHGIFAFEAGGVFIDIGTPEDYARSQHLLSKPRNTRQTQK